MSVISLRIKEHRDAAVRAGLLYVTDGFAGIRAPARRQAAGPTSRPTARASATPTSASASTSLAIPPAWTDVWICPDPDGHIQATARDARGRKQYRYHPRYREARDQSKFRRMLEFGEVLPRSASASSATCARRTCRAARSSPPWCGCSTRR